MVSVSEYFWGNITKYLLSQVLWKREVNQDHLLKYLNGKLSQGYDLEKSCTGKGELEPCNPQ